MDIEITYEKQNFQDGSTLYATPLNKMDAQIASNLQAIRALSQNKLDISQNTANVNDVVQVGTAGTGKGLTFVAPQSVAGTTAPAQGTVAEASSVYSKLAELNTNKANKTYVETQLAKFATKTELSGKADVSTVNNKADKTYVETKLQSYAKSSTVSGKLDSTLSSGEDGDILVLNTNKQVTTKDIWEAIKAVKPDASAGQYLVVQDDKTVKFADPPKTPYFGNGFIYIDKFQYRDFGVGKLTIPKTINGVEYDNISVTGYSLTGMFDFQDMLRQYRWYADWGYNTLGMESPVVKKYDTSWDIEITMHATNDYYLTYEVMVCYVLY